ncbi:hypothetical protein ACA910_015989 [Epithemia clementina (nom. ined.)]
MTNLCLQSASEILGHGLKIIGFASHVVKQMSQQMQDDLFQSHFGSAQMVVAEIWYDLTVTTIPKAKLKPSENSEAGLKKFLVCLFFLYTYPKNARIIGSHFVQSERTSRGSYVWDWVAKVAALKAIKIVWSEDLNFPLSAIFTVSVDGVDMKTWEKKQPLFPVNRRTFSNKFNHEGVKYELGIRVWSGKLVWINGPFRYGVHDLTVFCHGLLNELADGKMAIADRGYISSKPMESHKLATPNACDSTALARFKSRARARHETFNLRIKCFDILLETFHHSLDKHKFAFEAVCVIVQYQIDNGAALFDV